MFKRYEENGRVLWNSCTFVLLLLSAASMAMGQSVTSASVGTAQLVSLSVTPGNPTIAPGATLQFTATGTFTDGSTQNLTSSVSWSSSANAVATINSSGLGTGVGVGATTITATSGSINNSTSLTVTTGKVLFNAPPIMDMPQPDGTCLTYKSFTGGLYENCSNTVPADHDTDGRNFVAQIQPLDTNGNPSPTGKILFTSQGMSISAQEFAAFLAKFVKSTSVNNKTMVGSNGAQSNMDACLWFPAYGNPVCNPLIANNYDRIATNLATRGLNPLQVQVVWVKNANGRVHATQRGCSPAGTLCVPLCDPTVAGCTNTASATDALNLEQELANTLRAAKQRWPNLRLAFFASRIYGGYAPATGGDPEPYAYETGFAVKWLIQAQINQIRGLGIDPVAGDLSYNVAPWIAWGPYMWADGPVPRSDGLVWCFGSVTPNAPCNSEVDFASDGEHPTTVTKQVNMLMNFFLNSPYTAPWFAQH